MSFDTLGLCADILRALHDKGYADPTPIQRAAIPVVLAGRDVLAGAQTGTGKTAAFALPLLEKLVRQPAPDHYVRALILTPTRELAAQVAESVRVYGQFLPLRVAAIFGGVSALPQTQALERGVDILVATPGRLLDHIEQNTVDLSRVDTLILDEADRMLDMGFIRDIRRILAVLPKTRQNLLFSATFAEDIRQLADTLLTDPVALDVAVRNAATELVEHRLHPAPQSRKRELLSFLIQSEDRGQVLVFTRTKHGANRLAQQLESDGITTAAIHGNKSQGARTRALADFKAGTVRVLVATDIAARGLDIDQLPLVVNFDMPQLPEDYVHRIGRTGRAGSPGIAISLVDPEERPLVQAIESLLRRPLPELPVAGYEMKPALSTLPGEAPPRADGPTGRLRRRARRPKAAAPGRGRSATRDPAPPGTAGPAGQESHGRAENARRPRSSPVGGGAAVADPNARVPEQVPRELAAPARTATEGEVDGNSVHYVAPVVARDKRGRRGPPGGEGPMRSGQGASHQPEGPMRSGRGATQGSGGGGARAQGQGSGRGGEGPMRSGQGQGQAQGQGQGPRRGGAGANTPSRGRPEPRRGRTPDRAGRDNPYGARSLSEPRSVGDVPRERAPTIRTVEVRQRVRPGRPQTDTAVVPGIRRTERSK